MVFWSVLPHGKYVKQFWEFLINFLCLTDVFNHVSIKLSLIHTCMQKKTFSSWQEENVGTEMGRNWALKSPIQS